MTLSEELRPAVAITAPFLILLIVWGLWSFWPALLSAVLGFCLAWVVLGVKQGALKAMSLNFIAAIKWF